MHDDCNGLLRMFCIATKHKLVKAYNTSVKYGQTEIDDMCNRVKQNLAPIGIRPGLVLSQYRIPFAIPCVPVLKAVIPGIKIADCLIYVIA